MKIGIGRVTSRMYAKPDAGNGVGKISRADKLCGLAALGAVGSRHTTATDDWFCLF